MEEIEFYFLNTSYVLKYSTESIDNFALVDAFDIIERKIMAHCHGNTLYLTLPDHTKITTVDAVVNECKILIVVVPDGRIDLNNEKK